MIIKKAEYKKVQVTQTRCVKDTIYGCDECKSEIAEYPNEDNRLEITVFHKKTEKTENLHFCSWDCVLKYIPKIKTDYFVSLPFLYADVNKESKRGMQGLIDLIQRITC